MIEVPQSYFVDHVFASGENKRLEVQVLLPAGSVTYVVRVAGNIILATTKMSVAVRMYNEN